VGGLQTIPPCGSELPASQLVSECLDSINGCGGAGCDSRGGGQQVAPKRSAHPASPVLRSWSVSVGPGGSHPFYRRQLASGLRIFWRMRSARRARDSLALTHPSHVLLGGSTNKATLDQANVCPRCSALVRAAGKYRKILIQFEGVDCGHLALQVELLLATDFGGLEYIVIIGVKPRAVRSQVVRLSRIS
jgi:hypothetical protein